MCGRFIDPNLRGAEFELSEIRIDPITRRFDVKLRQDIHVLRDEAITIARWGTTGSRLGRHDRLCSNRPMVPCNRR